MGETIDSSKKDKIILNRVYTSLPKHTMKVDVAEPHVTVTIDGIVYIDDNLSGLFNFPAYVGFTAGTGQLTNKHLIDSLQVTETVCE